MKKLIMALAFVGLCTAANAQCDEFETPTTNKYSVATNSFWANWFVQAGVDANVVSMYGKGSLFKVLSLREIGTMVVLTVLTSQ